MQQRQRENKRERESERDKDTNQVTAAAAAEAMATAANGSGQKLALWPEMFKPNWQLFGKWQGRKHNKTETNGEKLTN